MSFQKTNASFEKWLRCRCDVVEADLCYKHKRMQKTAFDFLRATFFRWAGGIEAICPELRDAPTVLSVGDTHVENFGTWRDEQGRLVWGINDFDEAAVIPYPFDLVRLAASGRLAPSPAVTNHKVASAILLGYRRGLNHPRPTLLDEQETWMRPFVTLSNKSRTFFWHEVKAYPAAKSVPDAVESGFRQRLPDDASIERFATRRKGGGSLGRSRYVAIAGWRGGHLVREAKALVPSAWNWAHGSVDAPSDFMTLAGGEHRSPDPFLFVADRFIFRRIAPDARKVEFGGASRLKLHEELLVAMGFDLGSIHAVDPRAEAIQKDLDRRPTAWLYQAAKAAADWVADDFHAWKSTR